MELVHDARIHESLDAQERGGVDEGLQHVRLDCGLAPVHEAEQVLHHGVAHVWNEDHGVSMTTCTGCHAAIDKD